MKNTTTEIKTTGARDTRKHLLEAAINVFSRKGFAATRLEDIAIESGHTRVAISFHFKNKKNIFKESLFNGVSEAAEKEMNILQAGDPPAETLNKLINLMVDDPEIPSKRTRAYNLLLIDEPEGMKAIVEKIDSMFMKLFSLHSDRGR